MLSYQDNRRCQSNVTNLIKAVVIFSSKNIQRFNANQDGCETFPLPNRHEYQSSVKHGQGKSEINLGDQVVPITSTFWFLGREDSHQIDDEVCNKSDQTKVKRPETEKLGIYPTQINGDPNQSEPKDQFP